MTDITPVVDVKNLVLEFHTFEGTVHVLDGINLSIYDKEVLGLVGETGCGKTQFSRCIGKLLAANALIVSGEIFFKGISLLQKTEKELELIRGKEISYIFQEALRSLNPLMKIWEQMTDHIVDKEILNDIDKRKKTSMALLEDLGIADPDRIIDSYPHELSGGMRQRIAVAIAIINKPSLVIADEPTTAVDAITQLKLLRLFLDLKKRHKVTLLLITHNLGTVSELCDRVAVMYAGQIVEVASTIDLFRNPLHPYTRGLLDSLPKIHDDKKLNAISGMITDLRNPPTGCRFNTRCKHTMPACSERKPQLEEVENEHFVACYLMESELND